MNDRKMKLKPVIIFVLFSILSFKLLAQAVSDYDGNIYDTVTIGAQTWMKENLKVTHYNDGTEITLVADSAVWSRLTTPAYCWHSNDTAYKNIYGALYNWYMVNTDRLCPSGWHVPDEGEWRTLINYLGGDTVAGGKLKEKGTEHWISPNTGADNSSGFIALPGGCRSIPGPFSFIGKYGNWWSATEHHATHSWAFIIETYCTKVYKAGFYKYAGASVRCLKD